MKLPEMPSYPYIGQDWDDTARLLLEDWGKACYVAGEKQERALWELTRSGEAIEGEPAAAPVGWRYRVGDGSDWLLCALPQPHPGFHFEWQFVYPPRDSTVALPEGKTP